MAEQLKSFRISVERLLASAEVDWHEAARLVSEIAGHSPDAILRQAAVQAIPILRNARHGAADRSVRQGAKRRLCIVLDVLQQLTAPRFGTRRMAPKPLTREDRARRLLNLPLGGHLTAAEIRKAFRRAAKSVHPDAGGSEKAFLELIAAQNVLIRPGSRWSG